MSFFTKVMNTITCSRPWYYFWQVKYRIGFKYIHWLLKINGIQAPADTDPLWHYLLGELTDEANQSANGIAIKDLYLINNRLLRIRGFTLISITKGDNQIKHFTDLNAREAYLILGGLIQLPILNASNWSEETMKEKHQLMRTLHHNSYRMWVAVKKSCKHLRSSWQEGNDLTFNVGMQAFSILGAVLFSVKSLPDELFPTIAQFENIWGNPQRFSAEDLNNNVTEFQKIAKLLHQQRENVTFGEHDLLNSVFRNHQSRQFHVTSPADINIAAYFAFFENMSKAMVGLFTLVFSDATWRDKLHEERARLKKELKKLKLSGKSSEGFRYILSHSELFDRLYMEVLRLWSVAPVLPRINTNLFFNRIGNWGEEMQISEDYALPPLSLAVVPQFAISRSDQWTDSDTFSPMRKEYKFERNADQQCLATGKKPLVQGAEHSNRGCPAKTFTRKYFYAMMWWFPMYNDFSVTQEERNILTSSLPKDAFYRPLSTAKTKQVFGKRVSL